MSQPSPHANTVDPLIGQILGGQYLVEGMIARGGMGNIYRARHVRLGRLYAIKILRREFTEDGKVIKRFTREALAVSQLRHPHTVQVFDTGESHGVHFIVMEYLEGESLDRRILRDGSLELSLAVRLIGQAAAALAEAHKKGIVHRDLKPANLFLEQPEGVPVQLKILDFGIAKFYTGRGETKELTKLTAAGSTMGTPHYMAPEQIRGEDVDGRADIYSLGIILWECLAGRPPFAGDSPMEIFLGHLEQDLPPLASCVQPPVIIPHQVDAVIARAAARNPAHRFRTMSEFKAALDALLSTFDAMLISQSLHIPPGVRTSQSLRMPPPGAPGAIPEEVVRNAPTSPDGPGALDSTTRRTLIVVALAAVAVVFAIGLWLFAGSGDDETDAARAAASTTTAHVKLYSDPDGIAVRVDGAEVGKTPLRLDAPAGTRLEVELADGTTTPVPLELTPVEDEILGAFVVLSSAAAAPTGDNLDRSVMDLYIESEPSGATILQNGQTTGYVTPVLLRVPAGADAAPVEIALVRAGFVSERYRVYPRGGASTALSSTLLPANAKSTGSTATGP